MLRTDGGDGGKDVGNFLPAAVFFHACAVIDYEGEVVFLKEGCESGVVVIFCEGPLAVSFS